MDKLTFLNHFANCINNLLSLNFPLPIDYIDKQIHFTHKSSYFGICRYKYREGKIYYTIGINANFVESGTEKAVINTIYHELLHTLPECNNHGAIWKSYAKIVKENFGFDVKRCGGDKTSHDSKVLKNSK